MEGAQGALLEPNKVIDVRQVLFKLANEGKRGRPGGEVGDEMPGQYVGPGGYNGNSANPVNAEYFLPGQGGVRPVGGQMSARGYGMGGSHYGGPGPAAYGGMEGVSGGAFMYGRVPHGAGGYAEGGANWPSSAYPNQAHQPMGKLPAPQVPPGGMYGTMPPYY